MIPQGNRPILKISVLASGSKGNAIYIENSGARILIDAGLSARALTERLRAIGREPQELDAVFLTHEHSDHASGVKTFSRKYRIPVFATRGTEAMVRRRFGKVENFRPIEQSDEIELGGLRVRSYATPHDALESVAYVVQVPGRKIGFATDLGVVTETVRQALAHCDALFVEANHDEAMLLNGPYPWPLKQRIQGDAGHLSNTACAGLLEAVRHPDLRAVVLMHLSEHNNTPQAALAAVKGVLPASLPVHIAPQHRPTALWPIDTLAGDPAKTRLDRQMNLGF